jgi:predicted ATPase
MIDKFENIADLHEELLIFLLDYKESNQSDLTFMLRSIDNKDDKEALEKGWWFKGDENYTNLYFTHNGNHTSSYKNNVQITINKDTSIQINFYFEHNFDKDLEDKIVENFQQFGRLKTNNKTKTHRAFSYINNDGDGYYKLYLKKIIDTIEKLLQSEIFQSQNILKSIPIDNFRKNLTYINKKRNVNFVKYVSLKNVFVENYYSIQNTAIQEIPNNTKWIFLTGENGAGKTLILQSIAIGLYGKNEKSILPEKKETIIEVNYQSINTIHNINYHNSTKYLDFFRPLDNIACYGAFRLDIQNESAENQNSKRSSPIYGLFGNYDMLLKNIETELKFAYYENPTKFENLVGMLKRVIPTLHNVEFDAKNRKIYYYEKHEQHENEVYEKVSYSELATGIKSIIAMVGDIYLRFSKNQSTNEYLASEDLYGIVIIDEIDLYLHPKWQKNLPSVFSKVFPNVQFIVSTHSAIPILGAPENSVLLRVNRNQEDGITVERLEYLEKQLKDLTPNLILTSEIFGFQDIFPVTHDKSKRIRTEDTITELEENDEMMDALKSYMNTDKEEELLKLFSK